MPVAAFRNKLELELFPRNDKRTPAAAAGRITVVNSIGHLLAFDSEHKRVNVGFGVAIRVELDLVAVGAGDFDGLRLLVRVFSFAVVVDRFVH